MSKQVEVDVLDIAKRITIQVKLNHLQQWRWRIKLACWLVIVANWVAGFGGVEFEDSEEEERCQDISARV